MLGEPPGSPRPLPLVRFADKARWLMLGEPPGSPRPLPLVRFADKALRAFPEGGRFAPAAASQVGSK